MENYTTSNMENNREVGLLLTPQVKEFIKYYLEAAIISIYPSPKAYLIPQELPELIAFGGLANLYNQLSTIQYWEDLQLEVSFHQNT